MRLVDLIIVAVVGLGYLSGRRLSWLPELPIRLGPLALAGLLPQLGPIVREASRPDV